ncbi:MAG: PPC domain-containing protein [Pleurocapsa minor GSE-CHR-MK-17-07R]|jgi:3D (Asp-Asp-Asp) domain-containing protein|nr:PPC domain-containing protein [Pleurocapsa minor GSE-CHR-MK 17-07R]
MRKRVLLGGILTAALLALPVGASAQTVCPPGLTGDDCSAFQFFFDGIAGLGSVEFGFEVDNQTTSMGMVVSGVSANGTIRAQLSGGAISAIEVLMPTVTIPSMFGGETSAAAGYVFVDGAHYVGLGASIDTLAWQTASAGASTLPLGNLFSEAVLANTWSRQEGTETTPNGTEAFLLLTTLSETLTGVEGMAALGGMMGGAASAMPGMDLSGVDLGALSPELGALMGGMEGMSVTVDTIAGIGFDVATGAPAIVGVSTTTSGDLSAMLGGLGGGDAAAALGDQGLAVTSSSSLALYVAGINSVTDISAPAGATPMPAEQSGLLIGSASLGLPSMLSTYFSTQAALAAAGALGSIAGIDGGDLGGLLGSLTGGDTGTPSAGGDLGGLLGALTGTTGTGSTDALGATTVNQIGFLVVGASSTGTLAAGAADNYTFNAEAGQSYTISLSSPEFDTYLAVLDASGTVIASNDDTNGTDSLLENLTVPAGETTVRVGSFANFGAGTYTILISPAGSSAVGQPTAPAATPATAPAGDAIVFTGSRSANVDDTYTFQGNAGDTVTIDMISDAFDTLLRLNSPSGIEVATDDDSGDVFNAQIVTTLPETGEYTIVATSFSAASSGAYTITVTGAAGGGSSLSSSSAAEPQIITGTRESGVDNDFPVAATAGDTLVISLVSTYDNQVRLLDESGTEIGFDDDSGDDFNALLTITVPETGVYTVRAGAFSSLSEGDFILTISGMTSGEATASVGGGEVIRQWASDASATSSYGEVNWGPVQATGEPDTDRCGDVSTAWASSSSNEAATLTVMFDTAVIATEVNIYQTYNPGSITGIELLLSDGKTVIVPDSSDPVGNTDCPGVFTVDVTGQSEVAVVGVAINLDQAAVGNWNEIDAVELVGVAAG